MMTIAALAAAALAQETELWAATYNGPVGGSDMASAITADAAGNVYVVGTSYGVTSGADYATAKYDACGGELWVRRYDGPSGLTDAPLDVAVDAAGNVYVTGYSTDPVNGYDYATVKYDADGNELWVRRYDSGEGGYDRAIAIGLDAGGNVYVTGYSYHAATSYDYATVKYDPDGTELWARVYTGTGTSYDYATALAVDATGNVHVTGYSYDATTHYDYATVKYDPDGTELWARRYTSAGGLDDQAADVALDADGNVWVTGAVVGATNLDYGTVKYDPDGTELWVRLYDGTGGGADEARALALDAAGNAYVTGRSWGGGTGIDFATVKYDAEGNQQWAIRYAGSAGNEDYAYDVAVGAAGDAFVTGSSQETGTGFDFTTIKYSPAGAEVWVYSDDGGLGSTDNGSAVCADARGNVYVTGYVNQATTGYDFRTVKYGWRDLAVAGITVPDTLEPEGMLMPEADVWSLGSQGDTGRVFFFIERPGGGFYADFNDVDFPPAGWDTANADGGTFNWHQGSTYPLTPPYYATVLREPTLQPNDDWLITRQVRVTPRDTLYFWARTIGGAYESLQVYVSYTLPHPDSFQRAIQAFDFNNETYQLFWADFHAVGDTTVYIAFRYSMPLGFIGGGICIDDAFLSSRYYSESLEVFVAAGDTQTVTFPAWDAEEGHYAARCSVALAGDIEPGNDELDRAFRVYVPPVPPSDWTEKEPIPLAPGGGPVSYGGWLAFDEATNTIYGAKGNKQQEFYRFDLVSESWTYTGQLPFGLYGGKQRVAKKGSRGVIGGDALYYTAGNNTASFYRYAITGDTWTELENVPTGWSRKRVKGGNDMVYIQQGLDGYVYLLKGYKTEFYRFNTSTGLWSALPDVPWGRKQKYDKGSFLVYDGANSIYAHESKYPNPTNGHHFMFRYDLAGDTWERDTLKGMPLLGKHGGRIRSKKSKDGGSGAWYDGQLYALKGGNTQQFFRYDPATDEWTELDTMPTIGVTGRKKRVKYGADIVGTGGGAFYALKGNKTPELWYYAASARAAAAAPARDGAAGAAVAGDECRMTVGPNPLAAGQATLRYSLPKAGAARVSVFDVAGRSVLSRNVVAGRTGAVSLDVRGLGAGIYLVRFDSDGFTATGKLVIEK